MVDLNQGQARYLSILAAHDLRNDEALGLTVMRPLHYSAWEALRPACQWEHDQDDDTGATVSG